MLVLEEGTEADPDQLNFVVQFGNGIKLQNNKLVRKSGLNESSGLSLKLLANGSVLVRSVKDWGTSNWVSDIYLSFREGKLKISGFDHEWYYRERGGKCEFNLLSSIATINKKKIQMPKEDMAFGPDANLGGYLDFCLEQTSSK